MFLHEMQRQTEMEKLFHSKSLRLARAEDVSNCTVTRVAKVEQDLVQQMEIVSLYEDAIDRFDICRARLEAQEQRLEDIEQRLEINKTHVSAAQKDITDLEAAHAAGKETIKTEAEVNADLGLVQKDVDMLFDERDAMLEIWKESSHRISKLEDLVRQLTLHMLNNPSSPTPSPVATQRLPVQTTNGQNVEQSVPRGMKFTINGGKEISPIRSFTPGEQW